MSLNESLCSFPEEGFTSVLLLSPSKKSLIDRQNFLDFERSSEEVKTYKEIAIQVTCSY